MNRIKEGLIVSIIIAAIFSFLQLIVAKILFPNTVGQSLWQNVAINGVLLFVLLFLTFLWYIRYNIGILLKMHKAGIIDILFSRNELQREYSIPEILENLNRDSEVLVLSRTASSWSECFELIRERINTYGNRFIFILPSSQAKSIDWGESDLKASLDKFGKIGNSTNFSLYFVNEYFPFSFSSFTWKNDRNIGILECGAGTGQHERFSIVLTNSEVLDNLKKTSKLYIKNKANS
jgi:hypothetical protein